MWLLKIICGNKTAIWNNNTKNKMSSTTPTGPPPVPPTKPILSTPGSYMSTFQSGHTATIHSINKTHDKPAIAARPVIPPTVPKYSTSFGKIDRDRNEFGGAKIDRLEREKVRFIDYQTLEQYTKLRHESYLNFHRWARGFPLIANLLFYRSTLIY